MEILWFRLPRMNSRIITITTGKCLKTPDSKTSLSTRSSAFGSLPRTGGVMPK